MANIKSVNLQTARAKVVTENNTANMIVYPRIHMFSLDLSNISGSTKSGSMGMPLYNLPIEVSATVVETKKDIIERNFESELSPILIKLKKKFNLESIHWKIIIKMPNIIDRHIGLGSTTQVIGASILCAAKTRNIDLNYIDLFNLGIGYASALGLSLLFCPNFIIENGYNISNKLEGGCKMYPDIYNVYQIPSGSILTISRAQLYALIAIPKNSKSLCGKIEDEFWDNVLPDKIESTYKITYSVLEKIIPGLITNNYNLFIDGIIEATENGTKPIEESIQNNKTKMLLKMIREKYGFAAVSSLGPSIYTFLVDKPSDAEIKQLESANNDFVFYNLYLGNF